MLVLHACIYQRSFDRAEHSPWSDCVCFNIPFLIGLDQGDVYVPVRDSLRNGFDSVGIEVAVDDVVSVLTMGVVRNDG
jgi:hypothetical protein